MNQIGKLPPIMPQKPNVTVQKKVKEGKDLPQMPPQAAVVFTPAEDSKPGNIYSKDGHVINQSKIDELKAQAEASFSQLKEAVKALLERQGHRFEDVIAKLEQGEEVVVEVDDQMRAEAQAAVAEDGEFGVKATSERIIDFAKTISGGDKSKFDTLVGAIKEGFEAAKEAFGGELPEISQKTYDAVMQGLEAWRDQEEEIQA